MRDADEPRTGPTRRRVGPFVLALAAAVPCTAPFAAAPQDDEARAEREAVDPYTEGDPEVLEALGIRSLGPFRYGDGRTTEVVTDEAGGVPFLWIETEHFQLGCSLEPLSLPEDRDGRKRMREDLAALGERLPNVPRRVREVDPWLALHLYAARLEATYDAFVERMGLQEYAEREPYLGSGGPICVLITEKRSTLSRYTQAACNYAADASLRYFFDEPADQLFLGIAYEALEGDYHTDAGLHFSVVHGLVRVLATAVRGYYGEPPEWLSLGLGHWFARELVDDEILLYTTPEHEAGRQREDADFAVKVRARVENEYFPKLDEMLEWRDPNQLRFPDHMMAWSRVDFLIRADDGERAHAVLWGVSEPLRWDTQDRERVQAELVRAALEDVSGGDLAALDSAWAEWVEDTYPRR